MIVGLCHYATSGLPTIGEFEIVTKVFKHYLGHSQGTLGQDNGPKSFLQNDRCEQTAPDPDPAKQSPMRRERNGLSHKKPFHSTGSAPQSDMTQLPKQFSTRWFVIFAMSDPSAFIVKMSALCGESPSKAIFFPSGE